jgi:peptide/nickel transport system substrate-binding protein
MALIAAAVVVVLVIVGVVVASGGDDDDGGGTASNGDGAAQDTTLRIAVSGDVETLDSDFSRFQRSNEVNLNVQDQFFSYATKEDDGYRIYDATKFEGGSVASWKLSDDGKQIDLQLADGAKFAKSGRPVTADDFMYWFDRAQGTKSGYLFNVDTAGITDWEKTGPDSVRLTFARPSPYFFALFRDQSQAPVDAKEMKAHATDADPWAKKWKATHDAASGEYMIEESTPGSQTVLAANPRYHGPKPYFDRVVLQVVPSAASRALLLQRGEVDIAQDLSIDDLDSIRDSDGVKVLSVPSRTQYHLGFNNKKKPFDDKKIRQALSYAVPYDAIVDDVLRGQAATPQGPIARQGQLFDGSGWPYQYDLDRARQLLREAGVGDGFSFRLAISSDDPVIEEMAIVLKDSFKQIGVDMQIDKQTAAVFAESVDTRKAQAWLRSVLWYVDDPGYIGNTFYKCGALLNWMEYCNKQVDQLTNQLVRLAPGNDERRKPIAARLQRLVSEDAPSLILAEPNVQVAMRNDIEGYTKLPDDLMLYSTLRRSQ